MPCPQGVDIPIILEYYNEYFLSGGSEEAKTNYWNDVSPETHASNCISCGECEEKCPQKLPIRKLLNETVRIYDVS